MHFVKCRLVYPAMLMAVFLSSPAHAQSNNYSSTSMWGGAPGGVSVSGALESSSAHYFNGLTAGQVNAARMGLLTDGVSFSIQNIGTQNISSLTVTGNHNDNISIDSAQSSSNTGDISTDSNVDADW